MARFTLPHALILVALGPAIGLFCGCNRPPDPQKFGQILNQLPQVEGADRLYPLPQLDEAPDAGNENPK